MNRLQWAQHPKHVRPPMSKLPFRPAVSPSLAALSAAFSSGAFSRTVSAFGFLALATMVSIGTKELERRSAKSSHWNESDPTSNLCGGS